MAENAIHRNDGHDAVGNRADPYRGAPNLQPGTMNETTAGYGQHQPGQNYIPLSSHSRSAAAAAAAGFGGAALGGLAAKQHHDKHDERDFARQSDDYRSFSRKPVGGSAVHGKNGCSPNSGVANNTTPGYQRPDLDSPHGDIKSSYEPIGTTGGMTSRSPPKHGSPPAYNGTGNALSSLLPTEITRDTVPATSHSWQVQQVLALGLWEEQLPPDTTMESETETRIPH